jgi:PHD/YefM family antitoxin component YafN of YafNO toxin-antitoxin module
MEDLIMDTLMSVVTMPVSEVRKELNALLSKLSKPLFVTQHGHVKAVMLGIDRYNSLVDELEDARDDRDAELAKAVAEARTAGPGGDTVPLADVLREHGL